MGNQYANDCMLLSDTQGLRAQYEMSTWGCALSVQEEATFKSNKNLDLFGTIVITVIE